jgi:DegT/DnrJ/EryC1/StrS aminotransferase family
VNERTRAILCVHQIGMQCDVAAILAIAWRRSLVVTEEDLDRVVAALAEACAEADGRSDQKIRFAPSLEPLIS